MLAPRLDCPWALQGGRMTKADLVEKVTAQIARTAGPLISKKDCARVVDSFLDAVKAALAEQHNIEVRGVGIPHTTRGAHPVRLLVALLVALPLSAQTVNYEVSVPSPAAKLFHVKAEFPARGRDTLYLSLPAWSPGAYEIQNYARYVRHFGAKNPTGQALFWDRFDKDTWRVTTGRSDRVTVEFDYLA